MPTIRFVEETKLVLDDPYIFEAIHKYIANLEALRYIDKNPLPKELTVNEKKKLHDLLMSRVIKTASEQNVTFWRDQLPEFQKDDSEQNDESFRKVAKDFIHGIKREPVRIRQVALSSEGTDIESLDNVGSEQSWMVVCEYMTGKEIKSQYLRLSWLVGEDGNLTLNIAQKDPTEHIVLDRDHMMMIAFGDRL